MFPALITVMQAATIILESAQPVMLYSYYPTMSVLDVTLMAAKPAVLLIIA